MIEALSFWFLAWIIVPIRRRVFHWEDIFKLVDWSSQFDEQIPRPISSVSNVHHHRTIVPVVVTLGCVGWPDRERRKWRDLRDTIEFSGRKRRGTRGWRHGDRAKKTGDRTTLQKNSMHHIRKRHGFVRKGSTLADTRPGKTYALVRVSYGILCFGYVIAIRDFCPPRFPFRSLCYRLSFRT